MSGNFGKNDDVRVRSIMCNGKVVLREDCGLQVPSADIRNLNVKNDATFGGNVVISGNLNLTEPLNMEGNLIINGVQVVGPRQLDVLDISSAPIPPSFGFVDDGILQDTGFFGPNNDNFIKLALKINQITDVLRTHGLM